MKTRLFIFQLLIFLGGCAISPSKIENPLLHNHSKPATAAVKHCADLYIVTTQTVAAAGVVDSQDARIPGYPYLRINRFLSSYRNEINDPTFDAWLDRLQNLAIEGWTAELSNLSLEERQKLTASIDTPFFADRSLLEALDHCGDLLRGNDLDSTAERDALIEKAVVPDEYQTWKRVVGLYPLTALAFRSGIDRWHEETLEGYRIPLEDLPVRGELVQFTPAHKSDRLSSTEIADIVSKSSENPLRIPLPSDHDLQRLYDHFAPIYEIDIASENDLFGTPVWQREESPQVDISKPAVYQHLSHTRVGNINLLQLNYTVWFPSRPLESSFDLLGGHLDGITWRVTLLPDGTPWLYDTIHNCGCYHLFFPGPNAEKQEQSTLYREPAFTPQKTLQMNSRQRPILRIASTTHYIERVYFDPQNTVNREYEYQTDQANELRSLPHPVYGRRSLYGEDGLIAGSERSERFLFWPMGIPSPGGMRQWGHHATGFVGRRHFDDARLFDGTFKFLAP